MGLVPDEIGTDWNEQNDSTAPEHEFLLYCDDDSDDESDEDFVVGKDSSSEASASRHATVAEKNTALLISSMVRWAPDLVREVHCRPRLSDHERNLSFYNCSDYRRFRQRYRNHMLLKAIIEKRRRVRERQKQQQRKLADTPLIAEERKYHILEETFTWILNNIYAFFADVTSSESSGQSNITSAFPGYNVAGVSKNPVRKKDLHLELLVDTLYLY